VRDGRNSHFVSKYYLKRMIQYIRFFVCAMGLLMMGEAGFSQLRTSPNGRYLVTADGKPFSWLGDTAWELFHRLNREETTFYFQTRARQGFTVIQAVALAELDGLHTPNAYGHLPLKNDDPLLPQEEYFRHVDWVIDEAARIGLHIALLPTWGDKLFRDTWGEGPEIFTPANAEAFGAWIAARYRTRRNVIWVLGGDRNPRNDQDIAVWRAMARGIERGAGGPDKALITFHPQPNNLEDGGSSKWFHEDSWLDFNMFQTGHCRENNIWDRITVAYNRNPVKPVLDGETIYEDHPVCFNAKDLGTSSAYDVRKHAWFSMLSGSFGHTYGCHGVWQMYDSGRSPVNGPHFTWKQSLDLPGASQLRFLRQLMEARPVTERMPAPSLVADPGQAHNRIVCARGKGYILAYTAQGADVVLSMPAAAGWNGSWYDPRNGNTQKATGRMEGNRVRYTAPGSGYGQDWVLILDDPSAGYPAPGL
jgi:hypothetical protein